MSWRWAFLCSILFNIFMLSYWSVERQSVWGQWRKVWEERAMAEWTREKAAFQDEMRTLRDEMRTLRPVAIPERQKWTQSRFGLK